MSLLAVFEIATHYNLAVSGINDQPIELLCMNAVFAADYLGVDKYSDRYVRGYLSRSDSGSITFVNDANYADYIMNTNPYDNDANHLLLPIKVEHPQRVIHPFAQYRDMNDMLLFYAKDNQVYLKGIPTPIQTIIRARET